MFGWFKSKAQSKNKQIIQTTVNYYDSPTEINLYWDDVLQILNLVNNGNEESVKRLKQEYKLENKYGENLYVTLSIPQSEGNNTSLDSDYSGDTSWDFELKEVQQIYEGELAYREKQKEWEKEERERKEQYEQRNTIEKLQKDIKALSIKKSD
ncbi:TPA: hypothetical protein VCA30_002560 [Bacillus cereus]|uniref:hypothetical protein n=1 Tax=Bacillus cereus group TaxID=86661 RepID=UPI000BF8F70C|nr:hypothetical protein [Bacillus cereus]PFN68726.1 hypothetical protein COJ59_14390 [Bacillus cereus]HEI9568423.1 hypothetical protein [Bacillus cereus]HEI9572954.1 hypothetical protein [Bacillus cereus]HEI9578591.1 hypothetical protein [Bacillus cereus]HEP1847593.1 hypothetical protein [Bacillus cereus]